MFHLDPTQAVLQHVVKPPASPPGVLSDLAAAIADQPGDRVYSDTVFTGVARAVEIVLLVVTGLVVFSVNGGDTLLSALTALGVVAVAEAIMSGLKLHGLSAYRIGADQMWKFAFAWTAAFAVLSLIVLLFDRSEALSRTFVAAFWAAGLVAGLVWRAALHLLVVHLSKAGKFRRRSVIVGGGKDAEPLIASMMVAKDDFVLLGLFDDRKDERSPESVASVQKLGKVAELIEFARRTRVDLVIVSMPLLAEHRVLDMLRQLWVLPVDIRLSAHMSKLKFTRKAYSYIGGIPVFDMADLPISDWNLVFKWLFDKVVAVSALILLSPIMIATAVAIKLESKGPVFFRQKRHGFNNQLIEIWKFRSMRVDALDANATKLVSKNDPRVTRVGSFIRKTSIDELPQLFNVLVGELSIVGPRPHALAAKANDQLYYEAVEGYFARHRVKPGMTGWAQIHGWRGETDTVDKIMQRVTHDLYYIENWSLWLDLKIVLLTPISLITQRNNAF
ncbi:undecaprenyl-phosphate glucose phosphotransferase [Devosia sp. CN2-171]|uniref:undecaprenyl-phosphate glucose phosphotransferase n=1 Tax=Devosia sp. CN2-171 TaxID=3400909 RepID=UPI003BF8891C